MTHDLGIDWLELSAPDSEHNYATLAWFLREEPPRGDRRNPRGSARLEHSTWTWDHVGSARKDGTRASYWHVRLSGRNLAHYGQKRTARLIEQILPVAKIARIDLARTSVHLPDAAFVAGALLDQAPSPRARLGPWVRTRIRTDSWDTRSQGRAFYLGSPRSLRMLRIYDKTHESRGAVQGNRWELQLRNEAAKHAATIWLLSPDVAWSTTLRSLLDVRESTERRAPTAAWFFAITGGAQPARIVSQPRLASLAGAIQALRTQYGSLLAALCQTGDLKAITEDPTLPEHEIAARVDALRRARPDELPRILHARHKGS